MVLSLWLRRFGAWVQMPASKREGRREERTSLHVAPWVRLPVGFEAYGSGTGKR